jgi:hypothetical protein
MDHLSLNLNSPLGQVWWYISIIPAIQEVGIGRLWLEVNPGKKVSETPISKTSWVWWYTSEVLVITWEAEVRDSGPRPIQTKV